MNCPKEKWQTVGPSDALTSMFRAYPTGRTEEVQSNLNHLLTTFIESYRSTTTDEKNFVQVEKCCYESKVWYYKIVESFLQEDQKPRVKKYLSSFLEDTPFQRSLVLCCLEITLCTNKLAYHFSPRLLHLFNLAAYNLWEVVSLVLHTQVDLTLDVTKHLVKVVEMIVERLAWTRNSTLWEEIRSNEGQVPTCQQVMSPKELEDPMKMEQLDQDPIQAEQTSDQQSLTFNWPQRNISLYLFARKVYWLMHKRLGTLCSLLNLQDEQRLKIWTCFEYFLVHHFDRLRDCHLDWLLLCAIHGMTKNTKDELPFKLLIDNKNKHVSKTMPMLQGHLEQSQDNINKTDQSRFPTPNTPSVVHDQEYDSISCFYNQVYVPAMGDIVKKFSKTSGVESPSLSPYPTQPSPSNRKYRVHTNLNIFVSQLNKLTVSPAGMCYDFQSSPSQRLRDINAMVRLRRPPVKRGRELQLDEDDRDSDSGPSAKMAPMSSLQRRLRDIELDRMQIKDDKVKPSSDH